MGIGARRGIACLSWVVGGAVMIAACSDGGGNNGHHGQGGSSSQAAFRNFLDEYPGAFCSWLQKCGMLDGQSQASCKSDVAGTLDESHFRDCKAAASFYQDHKQALEACVSKDQP